MSTRTVKRLILFIISVLGVNLIGSLSALLSGDIAAKYNQLGKPILAPPSATFGIVWPILYFLMGVSLYFLIISAAGSIKKTALILFAVQLFINFIWSIIFFAGSAFWLGFVIIVLLDIIVVYLIRYAYLVNKFAAYLLVPYLIWIIFATYLTIGTAVLN